jgi:hypothetical protein
VSIVIPVDADVDVSPDTTADTTVLPPTPPRAGLAIDRALAAGPQPQSHDLSRVRRPFSGLRKNRLAAWHFGVTATHVQDAAMLVDRRPQVRDDAVNLHEHLSFDVADCGFCAHEDVDARAGDPLRPWALTVPAY